MTEETVHKKTDLVVSAYIMHEGKILLIKHRKLDMWLPPGGHIEKDETPDDALKREVKEEIDMDIDIIGQRDHQQSGSTKRWLATPFAVNVHEVKDHDHCCFFYACTPKKPFAITLEEGKIDDARWMTIEDIKQHAAPDVLLLSQEALEYGRTHQDM